jgi:hypothetical protein
MTKRKDEDPFNPTDLLAAIRRLQTYAKWDGDSGPDPYLDSGHCLPPDLSLLLRAVTMIDSAANHIDDADMMPIFEIRPECLWKNASEGLLACISKAIENEEAEDGDTFK